MIFFIYRRVLFIKSLQEKTIIITGHFFWVCSCSWHCTWQMQWYSENGIFSWSSVRISLFQVLGWYPRASHARCALGCKSSRAERGNWVDFFRSEMFCDSSQPFNIDWRSCGFTAETNRNADLFHSSASHEELVRASSKLLVVSQLCGRRFYPGYQDVFQCQRGIGKMGECSGV